MNDLVRLDKSQVKPAAAALTLAFQDYPLLKYAFPDEAERHKMAWYYCQMVLYYGIRYGEIYATSADFEGVAAWVTSDYFPMTFWKIIRSVPLSVIGAFSRGAGRGSSRMKYAGNYIDAMHKRHTPFKHWFFLIIGVAPQSQGKGYASQLIKPMLARMDEEGLPCYTETMDEKNVRLYGRFSFEVMEEFGIPDTQLTTWALLRHAR